MKQTKDFETVSASQEKYLSELHPVELPTRCNKTEKCNAVLVTAYRSLVSGIAWLGVTSPLALTAASLLQSCLPEPTYGDIVILSANLQKLKDVYVPLQYHPIPPPWRLISASDSAFANSGQYSQNGFVVLICEDSDDQLCGRFVLLDYKSNKSKRVATSTMHAESLSCIFGLETATFIQTQLLEISRPGLSAINLLAPETYADDLIKIVTCCDCHDVHAACIAPAQPTASNKHLVLYLAAIRELKALVESASSHGSTLVT